MILDNQALFSADQDLSQTAATYASDYYIDLAGGIATTDTPAHSGKYNPGIGNPVPLLIQVTETFTSAGAATLVVVLESDDDSAFGSATTIWTSATTAKATLVAGYRFPLSFLPEGITERYIRLTYTIGTATTTAGTITAGLLYDRQSNDFGG